MPCNPLPQSDAYANTLDALGVTVKVDTPLSSSANAPARCLIQSRQMPLLGRVNLISRGPVGVSPSDVSDYLCGLDVSGPLLINSEAPVDAPIGHIRLAGPRSAALLPLTDHRTMRARLHQKWRNALRKAESGPLVTRIDQYHPETHRWLTAADIAQQRARGYRNWPLRMLDTFAQVNPGQVQVVTALLDETPVAAMLFLCHRPWASYHLGVTTPIGRNHAAHHLTFWHSMTWLAARGYSTLDLGLLTGPDGLDRFKLRTGAVRHALGGTWLKLPRVFRRQFPSIQVPSGQNA